MLKRALLIFAKEPRPGKSKTRMTPPLTPDQAASLSSAFIEDTLSAALGVDQADVYLFYTPHEAISYFRELVPEGITLIPQEGADLCERCAHSVTYAFAKGYDRIVQIGTDTPQIRSTYIQEAFSILEDCDMALGPANDGGYYLLALNRPVVSVYGGVEMGTLSVFKTMMENGRLAGLSIRVLSEWVDADTFKDLTLLQDDPEHILGSATRKFLATLHSLRNFPAM